MVTTSLRLTSEPTHSTDVVSEEMLRLLSGLYGIQMTRPKRPPLNQPADSKVQTTDSRLTHWETKDWSQGA